MNGTGDAAEAETIITAGKLKAINENILEGLRCLRLQHASLRIWIDVVCIN